MIPDDGGHGPLERPLGVRPVGEADVTPAESRRFYVARPDAAGRVTVDPADPEFLVRPRGLEVGEISLTVPSSPDGVALDVGVGPGRSRSFVSRMPAGYASGLHRTDTHDFSVVLDGRVEFAVQTGAITMNPGDCVLVLGVLHAWRAQCDSVIAVTMTGTAVSRDTSGRRG